MNTTRLSCYKLTDDSGFAPNPFFGSLTLATCMPDMRQSAAVDDWIAGFTSATLCGDAIGEERLVFLMRVNEKITFAEYFGSPRFSRKIPHVNGGPEVERHGDNIYQPLRTQPGSCDTYQQLPNPHHWDVAHGREDERSKRRDLSGKCVLVASEFAYFGREALHVPEFARPVLPRGNTRCGTQTSDPELARAFIDFVLGRASRPVVAPPHVWPAGDSSWRH